MGKQSLSRFLNKEVSEMVYDLCLDCVNDSNMPGVIQKIKAEIKNEKWMNMNNDETPYIRGLRFSLRLLEG
jgi:hypothetical protein